MVCRICEDAFTVKSELHRHTPSPGDQPDLTAGTPLLDRPQRHLIRLHDRPVGGTTGRLKDNTEEDGLALLRRRYPRSGTEGCKSSNRARAPMEVRGTRMDGPIVQPGRNSGGLGHVLSTREPFSNLAPDWAVKATNVSSGCMLILNRPIPCR